MLLCPLTLGSLRLHNTCCYENMIRLAAWRTIWRMARVGIPPPQYSPKYAWQMALPICSGKIERKCRELYWLRCTNPFSHQLHSRSRNWNSNLPNTRRHAFERAMREESAVSWWRYFCLIEIFIEPDGYFITGLLMICIPWNTWGSPQKSLAVISCQKSQWGK